MGNRVFINQDDVIEQKYLGEQNDASVGEITTELEKLSRRLRSRGKSVRVLVDLGQIGHVSSGARKAGVRTLRELDYDRAAVYGASVFMNALANFVISASGQSHRVKLFASRDRALAWLEGAQIHA